MGVTNLAVYRLLSDLNRIRDSPAARLGGHVLESHVHRIAVTGRLRVGEYRAVDLIQAAGISALQTLLWTPYE